MSQQIVEGFQLSPQQKHLWGLGGDAGHMPYTAQCAIVIEGPLDREALRAALWRVVERQEILRTSFDFLSDMTMPLQVVNESFEVSIDERDLGDMPEQMLEARLEALLRDLARRQRSLAEWGMNVTDVTVTPHRHVLLISLPALCADTMGLQNLMKELAGCYAAFLHGEEAPEIPFQYADISEWQNESLEAEGADAGREYWRAQQWDPTALSLPFEHDPPEPIEFDPELCLSFPVAPETVEKLERVAALHSVSLSSTLLAAFCVLAEARFGSCRETRDENAEGRKQSRRE